MTDTSVLNKETDPIARSAALQRRALRIIKGSAKFEDRFVPDHEELIELVNILRGMGCAIVLTMGTWDFFHLGHSKYIRKGKEEAAKVCIDAEHTIMLVAVDTDELTKKRKGPKRPFVSESERVGMIADLRNVDIVTLEYNLRELPPKVPHDVRVISETTNDPEKLEEQRRYCTHLINLPPQLDDSSTARIRRLALEGRMETIEKVREGLTRLLAEIGNAE